MFTSRAEHRLLLREDNADRRLMPRGRELGLIDDPTWAAFQARQEALERGQELARTVQARTDAHTLQRLRDEGIGGLKRPATVEELLRRPGVTWSAVARVLDLPELPDDVAEQLEIDIRYAGYVKRAERRAAKARRLDRIRLPQDADWHAVTALSYEARERLSHARPRTVGQASRLPGITPAAVDTLVTWAGQREARP